jgi:hypothetical protein
MANLVCSFFMGFPGSVALSRCAILDGIGAKTQVKKYKITYTQPPLIRTNRTFQDFPWLMSIHNVLLCVF